MKKFTIALMLLFGIAMMPGMASAQGWQSAMSSSCQANGHQYNDDEDDWDDDDRYEGRGDCDKPGKRKGHYKGKANGKAKGHYKGGNGGCCCSGNGQASNEEEDMRPVKSVRDIPVKTNPKGPQKPTGEGDKDENKSIWDVVKEGKGEKAPKDTKEQPKKPTSQKKPGTDPENSDEGSVWDVVKGGKIVESLFGQNIF